MSRKNYGVDKSLPVLASYVSDSNSQEVMQHDVRFPGANVDPDMNNTVHRNLLDLFQLGQAPYGQLADQPYGPAGSGNSLTERYRIWS